MLEWAWWLVVAEVLWWLFVGIVGKSLWSLWRDIAKIPVEYH